VEAETHFEDGERGHEVAIMVAPSN
jgi:hypothetical protein